MLPRESFTGEDGFVSTQPISGRNSLSVYRGINMIRRGTPRRGYWEVWGGIGSLNEPIANTVLTGTVTTTANSQTVNGAGTKFTEELIPGQLVLINNLPVSVRIIVSDTQFIASQGIPASGAGTGQAIVAAHTIVAADIFRATLARGSVMRTAKGNLYFVGQGIVRLSGNVLSGSPEATPQLKLAIFEPFTGDYTTYKLGMKTPVLTTVAAVGGGTKNMQAGVYSVMIAPARVATDGFNNPSEAVEVTIATGDKIRVTFPAMDTSAGQDSWRVYGTLFSDNQGITGPWYFVDTVNTTQVAAAGGTYDFEWRDAEIKVNEIAEFNNDPPPAAAFVAQLANYPILASCNGPGRVLQGTVATNGTAVVTGTGTDFVTDLTVGSFVYANNAGTNLFFQVKTVDSATQFTAMAATSVTNSGMAARLGDASPGPVVRPSKPGNSEAYPASFGVATNPPETILGCIVGVGRLYLLTENHLSIATLTTSASSPITVRPFWHVGFRNAQSCVFCNGFLYGFTTNGAVRSVGDGDEGSEEHSFAADVAATMAPWAPEFVYVSYDQVNEAICYCYSPPDLSAEGFYTSNVLMYMLQTGKWSTLIVIESATQHRTITGVAAVSGRMYPLISGQTYGWDTGGVNVPWNLLWNAFDAGDPSVDKTVTGASGTAHTNGGAIAIRGSKADSAIDLETETPSTSKSLPNSTTLQSLPWLKFHIKEQRLFCPFISGTWPGTGQKSRVDELIVEYKIGQVRH